MSLIFETITMVSGVAAAAGDLGLRVVLGAPAIQVRGAHAVALQRVAVSWEAFRFPFQPHAYNGSNLATGAILWTAPESGFRAQKRTSPNVGITCAQRSKHSDKRMLS